MKRSLTFVALFTAAVLIAIGADTPRPYIEDRIKALEDGRRYANVRDFGAKGDNTTNDTAAIVKAIEYTKKNGGYVYLPLGAYKITLPITIDYSVMPIPLGFAGIIGEGYQSVLIADKIPDGRGVLELLGSSNVKAVNTTLRNFRIVQNKSCGPRSWCLRMGDAHGGFLGERLWLDGANGLQLRVASTTDYAQLDTHFTQLFCKSNYDGWWGKDTELKTPSFAMGIESGGANCDNLLFQSCSFNGLVQLRATIATFLTCQFYTHPGRPTIEHVEYANNVLMNIGSASFRDCYFEDHKIAIRVIDGVGPIGKLIVNGCYFSSNTNYAGQKCERAIDVLKMDATPFEIGLVSIYDNQIGKSYTSPVPISVIGAKTQRIENNFTQ